MNAHGIDDDFDVPSLPADESARVQRPRSTLGTKTASMPWEGPWIEIARGNSKKVIRNKIYTSPAGYVRREYSNYNTLQGLSHQFSSSSLLSSAHSDTMQSLHENALGREVAATRIRSRPATSSRSALPRPDSSPANVLHDLSAQVSRNFVRPKTSLGLYTFGDRVYTPSRKDKTPPARTPLRPVTALPMSKQKQLEERVKTEMFGDLLQSIKEEGKEGAPQQSPRGRKDEELKIRKPLVRDKSLTWSESSLSAKDVSEEETAAGQSFKKVLTPARKRLTNVMGSEGFSRVWVSDKSLYEVDPSVYFKMRMKLKGLREKTSIKVLDSHQWIDFLLYAEGKNERIPLNQNAERWISGLDTFLDKRARLRIYEQEFARIDLDCRDAMLEVNRIQSLLKIEQGTKKKKFLEELREAEQSKEDLFNERRRLQMLVNTFTIGADELRDLTADEEFDTGDPQRWSDLVKKYQESEESVLNLNGDAIASKNGWYEENADVDNEKFPIYSLAPPLSPSAHERPRESGSSSKTQKKIPMYERRMSRRKSLIELQREASMKEKGSQRRINVGKPKAQKPKPAEGTAAEEEPVVEAEVKEEQQEQQDEDSDDVGDDVINLLGSIHPENSAALHQVLMRLKFPVQTGTMQTWREFAEESRRTKRSYLTIYERICEHFKVAATGLVPIRRFLNDPLCSRISVAGENYNVYHLRALDGMMRGVDLTGANGSVAPLLSFKKSMDLKSLRSFDCSNNNLQAAGIAILVETLTTCGLDLVQLNVSANRIGKEGAEKVSKLLAIPNSSLEELNCDMNNIGDVGVRALAALVPKSRLRVLSIQKNKITKLGAVALKRMITSGSVSLEELDISWNEILSDGACIFLEGLAENQTLRRLNVEWSGFGSEKALQALFLALKTSPLEVLNLSSNQIDSYGCLVVAQGLESNESLQELRLDNNPLARQGIRELLRCCGRAAERRGIQRTISLENCDFGEVSPCVFDPFEPAGHYQLDMSRISHRRILEILCELCARGQGHFDKNSAPLTTERKGNVTTKHISLSSASLLDATSLPPEGVLQVVFLQSGLPVPCDKFLADQVIRALLGQLQRRDLSVGLKNRSIQTALGSLYIRLEDFERMLGQINVNDIDHRMNFVTTIYHRVVDLEDSRRLLRYLTDAEARNVEARIGNEHLRFWSNNPTGHYHLNLDKPPHRNIACMLLNLRFQMLQQEEKLVKYFSNRKGGQREIGRIGVCWRNCRLSGIPFELERDWKLPSRGVLELDFIHLVRPEGEEQMSDEEFDELVVRRWDEKSQFLSLQILSNDKKISLLREVSNSHFFSCQQVSSLLARLTPVKQHKCRLQVLLACWSRVVDYHGLSNLLKTLTFCEHRELVRALGAVNVFDELYAADYYDLDLSDPGERFIMQELVHLKSKEASSSLARVCYEGSEFEVPEEWAEGEVPRKGRISCFFTRTQSVLQRVFEQGAVDHMQKKPFPSSLSTYSLDFLEEFYINDVCSPADDLWFTPLLARRVFLKLIEVVDSPDRFVQSVFKGQNQIAGKELESRMHVFDITLNQDEISTLTTMIADEDEVITPQQFLRFWQEHDGQSRQAVRQAKADARGKEEEEE